jgi:hypothetical protein
MGIELRSYTGGIRVFHGRKRDATLLQRRALIYHPEMTESLECKLEEESGVGEKRTGSWQERASQ